MRTSLEPRVQAIGRELFEQTSRDRQAFYRADRWTAALLEWSLRHDDAKLQLFRFIDVARMFDLPFVLTGGGPGFQTETLTMYTYRVLFTNLQFGMGSALAVSVFIVVLIFSFLFIKVLGAPVGGGGSR